MKIVLGSLPEIVLQQMKEDDVVLAGGAIRSIVTGEQIRDIDIFCHSEEQAARLALDASHGSLIKKTFLSFTINLNGLIVQYVYYKPFIDGLDLIKSFDYLMSCAEIHWDKATESFVGLCLEGFYTDCATKTLTFRKAEKDRGTLCPLRRALKFTSRGWAISDCDLGDILHHYKPEIDPYEAASACAPAYGQ
jgi:hypothetical protein